MDNDNTNNTPSIDDYNYDEATLEARSYFFHELPLSVSGDPIAKLSPAEEQYLLLQRTYSQQLKEGDN